MKLRYIILYIICAILLTYSLLGPWGAVGWVFGFIPTIMLLKFLDEKS